WRGAGRSSRELTSGEASSAFDSKVVRIDESNRDSPWRRLRRRCTWRPAMTLETVKDADRSSEPRANGGKSMKFTFQPESKPLAGYTIKRAIHRGGFGEVYYALTDAGKEVALKLLKQHLDVELRGISQCLNLKHPNLVTIFDVKQDA